MNKRMKAVIFESEGVVRCVEKEIPKIKAHDDVLLRILAASVCGSDLHITSVPQSHFATFGVILGHECVAEIVEMGEENKYFNVGDKVLLNPMIPCGDCENCKKGQVNMCRNVISVGEDGDGIFAEYYVAKKKLLHRLSPDVDIDIAVFAEPLSCVLNGFKRLKFVPGQTVVVLGAGPIGLLFTKLAKAAGASTVVLTEIAPFRIDFARKNSGATRVIDLNTEDIGEVLTGINGAPEADVVIDTVGTQFVTAVQYAAYEGTILLFGVNDQVSQTIKQYSITRKELTVVSSYATFNTFPLVEKMLSNDVLDLKPLLTHRVDLEALPAGIEMLRRGEAMKVVVYPNK